MTINSVHIANKAQILKHLCGHFDSRFDDQTWEKIAQKAEQYQNNDTEEVGRLSRKQTDLPAKFTKIQDRVFIGFGKKGKVLGAGASKVAHTGIDYKNESLVTMLTSKQTKPGDQEKFTKEVQMLRAFSDFKRENRVITASIYQGSKAGSPVQKGELITPVGVDLIDWLQADEQSDLSPSRLMSLILDMSRDVRDLHRFGYVHRDIKLDNFIIVQNKDSAVKAELIDFELATNELQDLHKFCGTPEYLPPDVLINLFTKKNAGLNSTDKASCFTSFEQAEKADTFALGMVLYSVIMGKNHPFAAKFNYANRRKNKIKTSESDIKQIHSAVRDRIHKEYEKMTDDIEKMLIVLSLQMTRLNPEDRPSMDAVVQSLKYIASVQSHSETTG